MSERPAYPVHAYLPIGEQVRRCEAAQRPLWIRGGGGFSFHETAAKAAGAEICDTRGIAALVDHAADDMTVTVQAGMTVAELQQTLATRGQHLPIDAVAPDRTTIGGLIATGLAGSRRFSRGAVADLLIGVVVVGAGGEIIRGGGRVVKNVAGYDLCKLYGGSWGWLGVIVEATFKVAALPEASGGVSAEFDSPERAENAIAAIMNSPLAPASIDLLAGRERGSPAKRCMILVVGFDGMSETVDASCDRAVALLGGDARRMDAKSLAAARLSTSACLGDGSAASGAPVPSAPGRLSARLSVLSSQTSVVVGEIVARCPTARVAAHAGNGVINVSFSPDDDGGLRAVVEIARGLGGHWLLPRYDADAHADVPMIGPPRSEWAFMRKIKQALDPHAVFNRGLGFDRALA